MKCQWFLRGAVALSLLVAAGCARTIINSPKETNGYADFESRSTLGSTEGPGEQWVLLAEGAQNMEMARADRAYMATLYASGAQLSAQASALTIAGALAALAARTPESGAPQAPDGNDPLPPDLTEEQLASMNRFCDDHVGDPRCDEFYALMARMGAGAGDGR